MNFSYKIVVHLKNLKYFFKLKFVFYTKKRDKKYLALVKFTKIPFNNSVPKCVSPVINYPYRKRIKVNYF